MAVLSYAPPSLVGRPGIQFFNQKSVDFAQGALWRRMDFLVTVVAGTPTYANPNGALATTVPSLAGLTVTPNGTASPGLAQATLYGFFTYTTGTVESLPSPEFIISNTAGFRASVNVSATVGVPAGATGYNLYVGVREGVEWQQNPILGTPVALGTVTTLVYPLANSVGANRAATNAIGTAAAPLLGLANDDFDVYYSPGGTSFSSRSPFGVDVTAPPAGFPEQYRAKVTALSGGQLIEISLLQPWTGQLYQQAGINFQAATGTAGGCFVADTSQSNKILTILDKVQGPTNSAYEDVGVNSDTGARVICSINSTAVLAF
jgi:hypothetical protein